MEDYYSIIMQVNPSLKHILTLDRFKLAPQEIVELYPRAYALPDFFSHNLLSDTRVVKQFAGPYALLVAFYYQLMKLSLEIQIDNQNYRELIFRKFVQFELFGEGQLEDELFSDFQYRKFMKDFIELVQRQDVPSFERTAERYSIIDEILLKYLKIILPIPLLIQLQEQSEQPMGIVKKILQYLCNEFDITLTQIGQCFKFEESDTFLYVEGAREVYLAFNECYQEEHEQASEFKSSFQCGEDNSFITKYRSPAATLGIARGSVDSERLWIETKESQVRKSTVTQRFHEHKPQEKSKVDDYTSCESSRAQAIYSKKSSKNEPFQSLSAFLNKKNEKAGPKPDLYGEFTNSLILQEMPTMYRQGVKSIKGKYAERGNRASIKSYI